MGKSNAIWELYEQFPEAFSFGDIPERARGLDPNSFAEDDGDLRPPVPHVAILDAATRMYQFGTENTETNPISETFEEPAEFERVEVSTRRHKWFKNFAHFMLKPGLDAMKMYLRTYIVAAEGPYRSPAKDMCGVNRGYQNRMKEKMTEERRTQLAKKMAWHSSEELNVDWTDVCQDTYLRGLALHQLALGTNANIRLADNRRIFFDGCMDKKYSPDVNQDDGKRSVYIVENVIDPETNKSKQRCRYNKDVATSIAEGEQAVMSWIIKMIKDIDPETPRERCEKEFIVISSDTDNVLNILQGTGTHLLANPGEPNAWMSHGRPFRAKILVWYGTTLIMKDTRRPAPPPKEREKLNIMAQDMEFVDVFIWTNKLWCEINDKVYRDCSSDLAAGIGSMTPHHPVLSLVASVFLGENDFSLNMPGITHENLIKSYLKYSSWIGDLINPETLQVNNVPFIRMLVAAYYMSKKGAKGAAFSDYSHPSKIGKIDTLRTIIEKCTPNSPDRRFPTTEEMEGIKLRLEYHIRYNHWAPLDQAQKLDEHIEAYGYKKDFIDYGDPIGIKWYYIPTNTHFVFDAPSGIWRCLRKKPNIQKLATPPPAKKPRQRKSTLPNNKQNTAKKRKTTKQ